MNKKQLIRLTESDLNRIVKESVNKTLREAVLPYYYGHSTPDDFSTDDDEYMYNGDDMFSDDALHQAEILRKMTGDKLKIQVDKDGYFYFYYTGTLSIESLQLLIKIAKYLRTDRVNISDGKVYFAGGRDYSKSHRTQVGKRFFDNVPKEHRVKKPKVLHSSEPDIQKADYGENHDYTGLPGWGG